MSEQKPPPDSSDMFPASAEQQYFTRIEEAFVRLRGAPLLLSPKDWQIVRRWHEEGIPCDLVERTLEDLFLRRKERGATSKVSSLSYFRSAVERVWDEVKQLTSDISERRVVEPVAVKAGLERLASSLPEHLPDRNSWSERLLALEGEAPAVEQALETLDRELLAKLYYELAPGDREELDGKLSTAMSKLTERLGEEELRAAQIRLRNRWIREQIGLPVLSLFS